MLILLAKWYLVLFVAGGVGFAVLVRAGLRPGQAWAGGKILGLALITWFPWWLGHVGIHYWLYIGILLLLIGALPALSSLARHRCEWRAIMGAEFFFLLGFLLVILIRLDRPEILFTEKFMDFGILNTMLRTDSFPPGDFWLGGEDLSYYYWGILVWAIPLKLVNADTSVMYNVLIASLGGMIATLVWSLGKSLSSTIAGGVLAVFFFLLAGTPDGGRQLAVSRKLESVDIWQSTRLDDSVITEFPSFTLWLGDLHSHLLVLPLFLLGVAIAVHISRSRVTMLNFLILAMVNGMVLATNPWFYPAVMLISLLLVGMSVHETWRYFAPWMVVTSLTLLLCLLSALTVLPFLLYYRPPVSEIGLVDQGSGFSLLLYFAGGLLLPVAGAAWQGSNGNRLVYEKRYPLKLMLAAGVILLAVITHRPVLVFLSALLIGLAWIYCNESSGRWRIGWLLAAMGVLMMLVPEVLFIKDAYDQKFFRTNTVFKNYFQGWVFLSLALPLMLQKWLPHRNVRGLVVAVLLGIATIHPASLVAKLDRENIGLDGLAWMEGKDRAIVNYVKTLETDAVLLEAVGDSYSYAGRVSMASGVSSYLGWLGHQIVWRGEVIREETASRQQIADEIFNTTDVSRIRSLSRQHHIDYVIIGSLEIQQYPAQALEAISRAGDIVFAQDQGKVIRMRRH